MYGRRDLNQLIFSYLEDPDPLVRAECIIYLFIKGGTEGINAGTEQLSYLIESSNPEDSRMAAYIIGELEGKYFSDSLKVWLSYEALEVKSEAIKAAGKIASDKLLPQLIGCLREKKLSRLAREALGQYQLTIIPQLEKEYEAAQGNLYFQTQILKTLEKFPCEQSASVLIGFLPSPTAYLRYHAVKVLNRLRKEMLDLSSFKENIVDRLKSELREGYSFYLLLHLLSKESNKGFLKEEVEYRIEQITDRIFSLLALIYEQNTIYKAFLNFMSKQTRLKSSAIELLDTILEKDISRMLLPFLDDIPPEEKLRLTKGKIGIKVKGGAGWLEVIMEGEDEWLKNVAVWYEKDKVKQRFPDKFAGREEMIPILEKIYFLKGVPLFSNLSGEELRPVAEMFREVSFERGTTIFVKNDPGDSFYLILRGKVEVEGGGKEIAILKGGDFFGEMALLEYAPRTATIRTLDECDLLKLDRKDFSELLEEYPELAKGMLRVLSQRLRSTLEKLEGQS